MSIIRVLAAGVDTIHASAPGALVPSLRQELGELRSHAGDNGMAIGLGTNPDGFILQPHGWRGYPIWLRSARIELMLGAVDPFPPVFLQWHSPFIHTHGLEAAVSSVEGWLDDAVMEVRGPLRAARVDLYCDFQGWVPMARDLDHFTCRAVSRRLFEVHSQAHMSGRHFSGFTFGRGDVVGRIYDKSLEMGVRGERWLEAVWQGREPGEPVWRVEFQFRRRALRRFGLETLQQALNSRQELWGYGMEWLSLRRPRADSNRSRWEEAPVWALLRRAQLGSPSSPLVRLAVGSASQDRLVRGFVGYATSLAAKSGGEQMEEVLRWAGKLAALHLRETGRDFSQMVEEKRRRGSSERLFRLTPALLQEYGK